jgi:glutamate---cysteine ligase / carboxylate-amine ligase
MTSVRGRTHDAAAAAAIGETLGVEEEYHLVDPTTWQLAGRPDLMDGVAAGSHLQPELRTSQLEIATDICHSLAEVRAALVQGRREAARAAGRAGAAILAAATHPSAQRDDQPILATDRYELMVHRFGQVAREQNICGCHVHVGVPDEDTAAAVLTHVRPYLPLLTAMTCSSPFQGGVDTGYQSFRSQWWSLWPVAGPPPPMADAADYRRTVAELTSTGVIDDASTIYWDARISARYPTVEFRIGDVCTRLDDAVLHAALVRSLVRTVGRRILAGEPPAAVTDAALRAARWRAARFGLDEQLCCPRSGATVAAAVAVHALLDELRPDLEAHGEAETVVPLVDALLERGTSAARQRRRHADTGDFAEVVRALVEESVGEPVVASRASRAAIRVDRAARHRPAMGPRRRSR